MRIDPRALRTGAMALALLSVSACSPIDDAMVAVFGRSMRDQRSFDPYENTQLPPEGSVPFSSGAFPTSPYGVNIGQPEMFADEPAPFPQFATAPTSDFRAELDAMENPVPSDAQSLARGEEVFNTFCAVCHGEAGVGSGAYIIQQYPLLQSYNVAGDTVPGYDADGAGDQAVGYSDGYIYAMIRIGRGLMPEYGSKVTHWDRWHVVNYVRELQRQAGNAPDSDGADAGGAEDEAPEPQEGEGA